MLNQIHEHMNVRFSDEIIHCISVLESWISKIISYLCQTCLRLITLHKLVSIYIQKRNCKLYTHIILVFLYIQVTIYNPGKNISQKIHNNILKHDDICIGINEVLTLKVITILLRKEAYSPGRVNGNGNLIKHDTHRV